MALSRKQKEKIRNVSRYAYFHSESEKKDVGKNLRVEKESIPTPYQLRAELLDKLTQMDYEYEFVSPTEANCIIRVYQNLHFADEGGSFYSIYGGNCFTKKGSKWWGTSDGVDFELSFEKDIHNVWLFQDECVEVASEFFDSYLSIKKI